LIRRPVKQKEIVVFQHILTQFIHETCVRLAGFFGGEITMGDFAVLAFIAMIAIVSLSIAVRSIVARSAAEHTTQDEFEKNLQRLDQLPGRRA
jgi:hypothetical protein